MKRTLLFLMTLPFVTAIGISPATIDVTPDQDTVTVTLIADEPTTATLSVDGPLRETVDVPGTVTISGRTTVTLRFGNRSYPPGTTESTLLVRSQEETRAIGTRPGVSVPIQYRVPRNGSYLTGRFLTTTLRPGKEGSIPFEITNRGNATAETTLSMTVGDRQQERSVQIAGMDTTTTGIPVQLARGTYDVTATLEETTYTRTVTVGTPSTVLENLSVQGFDPLRVRAVLRNDWNSQRQLAPELRINGTTFPAEIASLPGRGAHAFSFQPDLPSGRYNAAIVTEGSRHEFRLVITDSYVELAGDRYERPAALWPGLLLATLLLLLLGYWFMTRK